MWHMPWQPHWDRRYQVRKQCIGAVVACNAAVLGSHGMPNCTQCFQLQVQAQLSKMLCPPLKGLQSLWRNPWADCSSF